AGGAAVPSCHRIDHPRLPRPLAPDHRRPVRAVGGRLRGARPPRAPVRRALGAAAALAVAGCGSSTLPPPAAEPAVSPHVRAKPAGRVVHVGNSPEGLVADPATGLVAVGLRNPDELALLDGRRGRVVRLVGLPESPRHVALAAPGGPVLVPAERASALVRVTLPRGRVESLTRVGRFPHDAASVGGRVLVGNERGNSVSIV